MAEMRPDLFESPALAQRRDRAMRRGFAGGADFLWREVAAELSARLGEVLRPFPRAAVIGTGAGAIATALRGRAGAERLVQVDPSPLMAQAAAETVPEAETRADPCEILPLPPGGFDLAISILLLHWANDPVGHLIQLRHALKPDGLMLAALFGGETLYELRTALAEAEAEITGGLSPRIAPMGEIRALGSLLQRAGLALPVADSMRLTADYASALHLMRDLRAMGETNILAARLRRPTRRQVLLRAAEIYTENHARPDGRVTATFEIVFLTGWAPGPDQPMPLRPGSAKVRLADALGTAERSAGEKPGT